MYNVSVHTSIWSEAEDGWVKGAVSSGTRQLIHAKLAQNHLQPNDTTRLFTDVVHIGEDLNSGLATYVEFYAIDESCKRYIREVITCAMDCGVNDGEGWEWLMYTCFPHAKKLDSPEGIYLISITPGSVEQVKLALSLQM